ncbi:hypothetical protein [Stomatohabitans albus]|uniref:hypothetical protein n=1 Tax=Stomatohabitans albus TaxID=3110766 RepID=UPI00300C3E12
MTTLKQAELLAQFDQPWRDGTPVFACCRKTIEAAINTVDLEAVACLPVSERVQALRATADPKHLDGHRCCVGHLADLAFDLPSMVEPCHV